MNVHDGIEGLESLPRGAILSIGNFDGFHLGHHSILDHMESLRADGVPGAPLVVVTFEPHPLAVLRPTLAPPRLTTYPRKQELLNNAGVDELVVLPPSNEVLNLTAEQFWAILRDEVAPRHLIEGSSFNFGKGRGGTIDRLREWSAQSEVKLHIVPPVRVPLLDLQVVEVSSSLIRWLISYGRVRDAAICLGRPYQLQGAVIRGYGRGRQLGTPTANIDCKEQLIPGDGVYVARCAIDGKLYPAAVSIGTMPTFGQDLNRQVEAHLIGFDGDLYERVIAVELLDWLRDQYRFADLSDLKRQIQIDFQDVREAVSRGLRPEKPAAHLLSV